MMRIPFVSARPAARQADLAPRARSARASCASASCALTTSALVTSALASAVGALGLLACGSGAKPVAAPSLPGDGSDNVAKPAGDPAVADSWQPHGELVVPPALAAPAPIQLPEIQRFTLSNGLPVFVIAESHVPVVSVQLAINAGRRTEPRARLGLAELTSNLLVKGTAKRPAAALEKAIEAVAGTLAVDSTYEATFASCGVLARDAATCFNTLGEIVSTPAFPPKDVEDMRASLVSAVRARAKNPRLLAGAHLQQLLWGDGHVRGWSETEETLSAITRDDVVKWHKTWFVPSNAILVVAGDVEVAQLRPQLERAFLGWKKTVAAPLPKFPDPDMPAVRIRLVDNPGSTQTQIRVGLRGISHADPRFFESLVWNYALGASAGARMSRALRALGAVNMTAESTFDRNADRGSIIVSSASRNTDAVGTLQVLLSEMAKLAKDGPTAAEVNAAIAAIGGNYLTRFDAVGDIASDLLGAELHGFGEEYVKNFPLRLAQVTVESAKEAAAQLLDLNTSVVVLVGDAKDIEPALTKTGWRFEKVKVTDPVSSAIAAVPAEPQQLEAARKVLDAAIKAKGDAKLRSIKALSLVGKGTTTIDKALMPVEMSRWFLLPDQLRIDVLIDPPGDAPPATIQISVDGNTGWQRSPDGTQDIASDDLASIEFERWREPELVLLQARDPQAVVRPMPDSDIDGKPYTTIRLSSPFGIDLILAFDKQTMLMRRMSYTISGESNVDDFSDYRDVNGVKVAFKRVSTAGGRVTTVDVSKVEINPKIDPAIFKKPAP
jgi:zinc protease